MPNSTELPILTFESKKKFAEWLAKNHDKSAGVRVKLAKKGSGIPSITIMEALDAALCYGWIDGQRDSFDENYYLQNIRLADRRVIGHRSMWRR